MSSALLVDGLGNVGHFAHAFAAAQQHDGRDVRRPVQLAAGFLLGGLVEREFGVGRMADQAQPVGRHAQLEAAIVGRLAGHQAAIHAGVVPGHVRLGEVGDDRQDRDIQLEAVADADHEARKRAVQHDDDVRLVVGDQLLDGIFRDEHGQHVAGQRKLHQLIEELEVPAVSRNTMFDPLRINLRRVLHGGGRVLAEDVHVITFEFARIAELERRFDGPSGGAMPAASI